MRRLLFVGCFAMSGVVAAVAAELAATNAVLAATAEVAPFGDVTRKVTQLGMMINNPIVPTLLLSAGQQQLVQSYGPLRSDSPIYAQIYIWPKAFEAAIKAEDEDAVTEAGRLVLIYPSADGAAKMALNHPGSTKAADGTLHILASEDNPEERWFKFTPDGRYCAIAPSAGLANRAIADFAAGASARVNTERPILRLDVSAPALDAFASLMDLAQRQGRSDKRGKGLGALDLTGGKSQLDALRKFARTTLMMDLDDKGITCDCSLTLKPGVPPPAIAGRELPAGVLDLVPAEARAFVATLAQLQCECYSSEAEFKTNLVQVATTLRTDAVSALVGKKDMQLYATLVTNVVNGLADVIQGTPYPAASDWTVAALAFDSAKHPYLTAVGDVQAVAVHDALRRTFLDRVGGALERQWPGKGILGKSPAGHVLDWAAVLDVAAAESGVVAATNAAAIAAAKKTVASVLGGTKTELTSKIDGTKFSAQVAVPGFKPSGAKPTGEARVAAALPEVVAARPCAVFYFPLYGLVRDIVLPVCAQRIFPQEAQQYETLLAALPPAEVNSAIAGAAWMAKDGGYRGLMRLTANEVKNYGAAFNAFTAASMASALDGGDGDSE